MRPRHSLASGGDGRESLASEATGDEQPRRVAHVHAERHAGPDLVRGVAGDEVLRGLGRMFQIRAPVAFAGQS